MILYVKTIVSIGVLYVQQKIDGNGKYKLKSPNL